MISAIKKAEDDQALVCRLFETEGKATTAKVKFDRQLMGKVSEAFEVDFIERPIKNSSAKVTADGFAVDLPKHAITSVMVRFKGIP